MTLKIHKVTEESKKRDKELLRVSSKALPCSECNRIVEHCSGTCVSVICPSCVQKMIDPPEVKGAYVKKFDTDEERPHGWWLKKEYTSPSGKMYQLGVEINATPKKPVEPNTPKIQKEIPPKRKRGRPKKSTS
jgi:hypothetical protein